MRPYKHTGMSDEQFAELMKRWIASMNRKRMVLSFKFYNKDHLGNIREVVSKSDSIEQVNEYYPFGTPIHNLSNNPEFQPFKYNEKEFDMMHGLNTLDYGARQYNPVLPVWDRVDPLAEDYYNVSPYVYCINNPNNAIDPDGMDVWIRYVDENEKNQIYHYNGTQEDQDLPNNSFVRDFINTYKFLKSRHAGKCVIKGVEDSKYSIVVQSSKSGASRFDHARGENTVIWASRKGLKTTAGGLQSPATGLEHEFSHATKFIENPILYMKLKENKVDNYDNELEHDIITKDERNTALKLSESIRKDHYGTSYRVLSPTTIDTAITRTKKLSHILNNKISQYIIQPNDKTRVNR